MSGFGRMPSVPPDEHPGQEHAEHERGEQQQAGNPERAEKHIYDRCAGSLRLRLFGRDGDVDRLRRGRLPVHADPDSSAVYNSDAGRVKPAGGGYRWGSRSAVVVTFFNDAW